MTFEEIQNYIAEVKPHWVRKESLETTASMNTTMYLHAMVNWGEAVLYEYRAVDELDLLRQVHKGRMKFKKLLQEKHYIL